MLSQTASPLHQSLVLRPKLHPPALQIPTKLLKRSHLSSIPQLPISPFLSSPLPSLAAEAEQVSDKINFEALVIAIDDFFNRNPFFVTGATFIWLAVIPRTQDQEYLKKYKFISAIDAFRKLQDYPGSQFLDLRKKQSLAFMGSPNLKVLNKSAIQVEFREGDDDGFVKEVMRSFRDPGNTVVCVVDKISGGTCV